MWIGAGLAAVSFILLIFLVLDSFGAAIDARVRQQILIVAGTCELGAGILLLSAYKEVRVWLWLLEQGRTAEARVTAIERSWFQPFVPLPLAGSPRRAIYVISYVYRDTRGQIHSGRSGYLTWAKGWKVGDEGIIYYDPARPNISVWTG